MCDALRPARIDPDGIYHEGRAALLLNLPTATLQRARRENRLRYTRQGRAILYRGQWLLDWLEYDAHPAAEGRSDG
ncbi:Helix-turn-helix domain protein [Maioricimonas rarisocia]|uniref:Helix-turn-helix domain protein n=1 Tax=Maioricimonas rarisocia TaxID=2528026 RepID=A0A517Z9Q1_9PLAN|nr:helix-turn-helix domain-containing protein [Maioricimonas rarisocia]QDU39193.1 Helix-turn-helix domain protein [Maioricimonas rarisocia]